MNRAWLMVVAGGVLETGWATSMKLSDGFSSILWTVVTGVLLVGSVLLLNRGLKGGLPMGVCYSVWVGIGALGSIVMGMLLFGEYLNALGWVFFAMVVAGVIGLNLVDGEPEDSGGAR